MTAERTSTTVTRGQQLAEWRCRRCNRLLIRFDHKPGSVSETRCERCGTMNVLQT